MILAVLLLLTTVMGEAQSRRPRQSQRRTTYSRVQPVRFGLKAGINSAGVDAKYGIDADRVVGVHFGPMMEFHLPVPGLYIDGAMLFSQRGIGEGYSHSEDFRNDYIDLPVTLKYRFPVPRVAPFIETGPYMSFRLTGDKNHYAGTMLYSARDVATGWNFTGGIDIVRRVQLSLTYNLGITDYYRATAYPPIGGLFICCPRWCRIFVHLPVLSRLFAVPSCPVSTSPCVVRLRAGRFPWNP